MTSRLYNILGVSEGCPQNELKKAFHSLSLRHHPDRDGGNADKFKEILRAYKILSDPVLRRQYDLGFNLPSNGFADGSFTFAQFCGDNYCNVFSSQNDHNFTKRSENTTEILFLDMVEVCNGSIRDVYYVKKENCPFCVALKANVTDNCFACNGKGIVDVPKKTVIEIKPGILEDQEIFKIGEGDEEPNKRAGDRVFRVKYLSAGSTKFRHLPFCDIAYQATITLAEAVWFIQCPVKGPRVGSDLLLTKCTKGKLVRDGAKMFVTNEGIPHYFNPERRGKLIVEFCVAWPKIVTTLQIKKMKSLFCITTLQNELFAGEKFLFLERVTETVKVSLKGTNPFPREFLIPVQATDGMLTKLKNKLLPAHNNTSPIPCKTGTKNSQGNMMSHSRASESITLPDFSIVYNAKITLSQALWLIEIPLESYPSNILLTKHMKGKIAQDGDRMFVRKKNVPTEYLNPEHVGTFIVRFTVQWPTVLTPKQIESIKILFPSHSNSTTHTTSVLLEKTTTDEEANWKDTESQFPNCYMPEEKQISPELAENENHTGENGNEEQL